MSKPSILPWYIIAENTFLGQVPHVKDEELDLPPGTWLTLPGTSVEAPSIILRVEEEWITFGIAYETPEGLARLRNVLNMRNSPVATELVGLLKGLDPRFKTKLQRKTEANGKVGYVEVKSYVSAKVDAYLLTLMLVDAEAIKQEGFKARGGPKLSPSLSIAQISVQPEPRDFAECLRTLKPLHELASNLRSRAAAPRIKVDKARVDIDSYRAFTLMLNEARGKDMISAESRRAMDKKWREDPESREILAEELGRLLAG